MMAAILSHKAAYFWAIVLLGLSSLSARCEARAVNVSNTWTMPQEGLNVFYRFFRDRISWFEADAVCQFHHANLVTVDNSFQFDATRDLLRELDVNDIVWIGLMRPQNGDRFMWSNSRPLIADTGYWAESLPLMDAPLCAVIDPIRDYRWHALRCGGPETASFLCEMPVPSWADACILRDMPNLTMQYMADTASVELIRNCEEEGLIRQSCKSKQDRERVIRELICPRERLEAQRINDITNSHFKSLQIINSIRTDNNENNDIELLPLSQSYESNRDFVEEAQTEKNTVQRLIEQFNVDELMQADEPLDMNNGFIIPGEIPKPVKKYSKKVIITAEGEYPPKKDKLRKYQQQQQQQQQQQKAKKPQKVALEDMMLGDQPMQHGEPEIPEPHSIDDDVSNEIMEPLPHQKKILPQDLRTMRTITEQQKNFFIATSESPGIIVQQTSPSSTMTPTSMATTTTTTTTSSTTTASSHTSANVASASQPSMTPMVVDFVHSTSTLPAFAESTNLHAHTTGLPAATVAHPIHPQQPHGDIFTEEAQHEHVKESIDNSHFIPPLLMVKSHYVSPTKHAEHGDLNHGDGSENNKHQHHPHERKMEHVNDLETSTTTTTTTTTSINDKVESTASTPLTHAKTIKTPLVQTHTQIEFNNEKPNKTEIKQTLDGTATTTTLTTTTAEMIRSTIKPTVTMVTPNVEPKEINIAPKPMAEKSSIKTDTTTEKQATIKAFETTTRQEATITNNVAHTTISPIATKTTITTERTDVKKVQTTISGASADKKETSATSTAVITTSATSQPIASAGTIASSAIVTDTVTIIPTSAETITTTSSAAPLTTTSAATPNMMTTATATPTPTTIITTTDAPLTSTHNFLKEDTETPFKPNRRRSLTKPETVSYFKKILG